MDFAQPYTWYEDLFCKELGLCERSVAHWGWHNYDPERIVELADYYVSHPMYSRVGREMLIESVMESAMRRIETMPLSSEEEESLRRAITVAMADVYDRDQIRDIWIERENNDELPPLTAWLHAQFPGWKPPPSIWSTMQ